MKRPQNTEHFTNKDILDIINDIRRHYARCSQEDRELAFEKKYPEFTRQHPHLCRMASEDNFDMDLLMLMLNLRESIDKQEVTFEDASKTVGQVMFDTYIKDKIPAAPPQGDAAE